MVDMNDPRYIAGLKSNMHATFDTDHGKEVMKFLEKICAWYPTMEDSTETNDVIARDATRRVMGTIKTILMCNKEQLTTLINE